MKSEQISEQQPVVAHLDDFDCNSGSLLERALFNHRWIIIGLCFLLSGILGWQASQLEINASFKEMIPAHQSFIRNYFKHKDVIGAQGNSIRIAVEISDGTIFSKKYLETLQKINNAIYLMPGVDRSFMKSLWTSTTRWTAVTKDGLDGGRIMPLGFRGTPSDIKKVRENIAHSSLVGDIVADNFKSSVIYIPLLTKNTNTGQPIDYKKIKQRIDRLLQEYKTSGISYHVVGFGRLMGDLIAGMYQVLLFFLIALVITAAILYSYTRCVRSTTLVVACTLVAVLWQLGLVSFFGYHLGPYSLLVPFLIFAIGMSHGAQKMNGIMQDIGRGTHRVVAARYTFRRLFAAGLTALLCDAIGFAVLIFIRIKAIQDLAVIASIGVAILIFTNLILLPILLSYTGVSRAAALRSLRGEEDEKLSKHWMWHFLNHFTKPRWASAAIASGIILAAGGVAIAHHLQIGDLDPGAPELRPGSKYNRDIAFMNKHYSVSSDVFIVMVSTPKHHCMDYDVVSKIDTLAWRLQRMPGVQFTDSMARQAKRVSVGFSEGNRKWYSLTPDNRALAAARSAVQLSGQRGLFDLSCSLLNLYVYLDDHKAATLSSVVNAVQTFAIKNNTANVRFEMAAGNAGIASATNIVVGQALHRMLIWVYGAVILLAWLAFRSWRGVLIAILPLMLTSVLAEALMVSLGMGVKVATLPVVALGVGIGVDYALYVLSVMLVRLRRGDTVSEAYYSALLFTGKVVLLTGFELAIAVATWAFSPIKFQADMGILLAFMFLWNMVGALVFLPALAHFLFPEHKAYKAKQIS